MSKNKKKKLVNRHRIGLKESILIEKGVIELEMKKQMIRTINEAYPDQKERLLFISNLIKELEDAIAQDKKNDELERAKGNL